MKTAKKLLFGLTALAMALQCASVANAGIGDVYSNSTTPFQGLTFTFTQTDADTLTFEVSGTPSGDWTGVNFLGAFDLKDIGLNFNTVTGTANGPGATNLAGLNSQLSASSVDCQAAGSPPGSICFDINPDQPLGGLPFDFLYTIDFSAPLNITNSLGPHLQIAFMDTAQGPKVGSLYSQNIAVSSGGGDTSSSSSSSSTSSSSTSGGGDIPEPGTLTLLGAAILGGLFVKRRRQGRA